jgi:hypothetical protein
MKTLTNTILPRIALYDVLIKYEPETAVSVMRKYMMNVVAYDKHASTEKMEKIPGFFSLTGTLIFPDGNAWLWRLMLRLQICCEWNLRVGCGEGVS